MTATDQAVPAADARPAPLNGVRVVDLTTFLSGPFCTQILADLGAEIIKVEPFGGDSSRAIPPHFVGDDSAYYLGNNRSKRSIALDLKSPEGLRIARDLIARSDVVVENFRPGVCERLGLDVDALRAERPDLVWASISGFGQTGPWRDRPAYDMIVQALSGVMSLTGEVGRAPVRAGVPIGDLVAGLYAAIGVLAGLAERGRGVAGGRTIDVSMLDCQLAMLSYQAVYAMHSGTTPAPQGRAHDSIPTYRAFTAGDGRALVVTANTERMWAGLCHVLGLSHLVDEPRFADGGGPAGAPGRSVAAAGEGLPGRGRGHLGGPAGGATGALRPHQDGAGGAGRRAGDRPRHGAGPGERGRPADQRAGQPAAAGRRRARDTGVPAGAR
jgi:crotonobetainyl-CoA:carnitine CoA-transferase CaiB-like acyl-CoA transferase